MTTAFRFLPFALVLAGCSHTAFVGGDDAGDAGTLDAPVFSDVSIQPTGSIRVTPATAALEIDDGQVAGKNVAFTAEQLQPDGATWLPITSSCAWTLGDVDVGGMNGATFVPSGLAGAQTSVTCKVGGASGSATLTVNIVDTLDPNNLDTPSKTALLGATTGDPSIASLLYPYDKTVFPRGLAAAPEVMWDAPTTSDLYAFVFEEPYAKVTAFFNAPNPGRFLLPTNEWDMLGASNPDGKLTLKTYRLAGGSGGTAYAGPTQAWTMSRASLKGTAYFWQLTNSQIGDVVRMPFKQSPAIFLDKNSGNGHCTGCHSVAAKADVIAAGVDVYVYGAAFVKSTGATIWEDTSLQTGYRATTPDGNVIASLNAYGPGAFFGSPIYFLDAKTGQQITGAPNFGLTNTPAFSASNKLFAFSVRQHSDYATYGGQEYHDQFCGPCDIGLADYDSQSHATSNPRTLVSGQGKQCNLFPTVTPDDSSVVFERALSSENRWHSGIACENANGANQSSLWMVDAGGKNPIELANASASSDPINKLHSYRPIFSPVPQGGYFWLMFTGLRTYGNRLTQTSDYDTLHCQSSGFSDCRHQQIWVAAVDVNTGSIDPSHPAFWLPGQDTAKQNFDAQWSLDACKANGQSCEAGFECCTGTCADVNGTKVCNPPSGCHNDGDVCTTTADCCGSAKCVGGVCSNVIQ